MEASIKTLPGRPEPLGLTHLQGVANFSLFSAHATKATLCLFWSGKEEPDAQIPMQGPYIGIWHVAIEALPKGASYAYRLEGKDESFDPNRLLSDPYARAYSSFYPWADFSKPRLPFLSACDPLPSFDWQGIEPPHLPLEDLVIYEMHVRGFTIDSSSGISAPGTFTGLIEKIPYLQKLGITAVELMPVFEFDETHSHHAHPETKQPLVNYWGYSPLNFFLPMSRFAKLPENAATEFKTMVRELHRAGIEVILDVVYNHTPEEHDYVASYRGIDRETYYMLNESGEDKNYSGCGNTFQVNGAPGLRIILDSLRYWTREMKVDGFRFDLASILTRGEDGKPLADPPILKTIAKDPILKKVKLIAEPWDAAGLYQAGQFPKWGHWSGWNGHYRDHVRRFIKGTNSESGSFANALTGSEKSYGPVNTPLSSINFITSHDGYSLYDLVSYMDKHNEANGEDNHDGTNCNDSWNGGVEGPTDDTHIQEFRDRQMRNFWLALLLSQGIPMFHMGDEIAHTCRGNNNPYAQDNEINWFSWKESEKHEEKQRFVSSLITFRKMNKILHRKKFLKPSDIEWHGHTPSKPNWNDESRFVAYTLRDEKQQIYIAFNAHFEPATITLPSEHRWRLVVNTALPWNNHHLHAPEEGDELDATIEMLPYSSLIAIAR